MSAPEHRFLLRLPPDLFVALKARADAETRSVNGQAIIALREHLNRKDSSNA
jgi:hypothetical protein